MLRVIYGGLAAQSGYAPMPAIGQDMTEQQVKDVTDYIRNSWGNKAPVMNSGSAVSEAKAATQTMLAGTAPCAEIEQEPVRKAIEENGVVAELKGLTSSDFIPKLATIVPKVKAAAAGAKDDDIVNGLTTAFCQAARDEPGDGKLSWSARIGSFSNLAYSQIKHPRSRRAPIRVSRRRPARAR